MSPAGQPIRVLVVDDQDIVRDGLVTVLSLVDGLRVVGAAGDGGEAIAMATAADEGQRPDVVLMDLRMPGLDGVGATAAILADRPSVAVLVLTTFADDDSIGRALRAGARGYLTKDASREDIAVAIRAVARGQATFDPAVSARLISGLGTAASLPNKPPNQPTGLAQPQLAELTGREREVLRLIGDGLTNTEIADRLFVSVSTVKTHINNLFAKLALRDRTHAVRLAAEVFG